MSKYTTQLRYPVEQKLNDLGLALSEDNWNQAYKLVGLDDYPIFEEAHRDTLNRKILRRYWFREIGFETVAHFAWMMRRTMHEIMPYYNQLYLSESLVTDPLLSMDRSYKESWDIDRKQDSKTTDSSESKTKVDSTTESNDRNVYQDTPMNALDTGAVKDLDYATNVTYDDGTVTSGTNTDSTAGSTSETGRTEGDEGWRVHEEKGYSKSQSKLLQEYRDTFLNIDLEVVDRLDDLFMHLW